MQEPLSLLDRLIHSNSLAPGAAVGVLGRLVPELQPRIGRVCPHTPAAALVARGVPGGHVEAGSTGGKGQPHTLGSGGGRRGHRGRACGTNRGVGSP